jgi:uncharacterized damage-inducible protein DinB
MIATGKSVIKPGLHERIKSMEEFFNRSTQVLTEGDSTFVPAAGMFTTAQHVAHTAQMIDWFVNGAFARTGFELNFEKLDKEVRAVTSLTAARVWLKNAFERAHAAVDIHSDEEWSQRFPAGMILGNRHKIMIVTMMTDHVAHHLGALTVYSRLLGKIPPLPYIEPM